MRSDQKRCLEAGLDKYIAKPVGTKQIEETIALVSISETKVKVFPTVQEVASTPVSWDHAKALERLDSDEHLLDEVVEIFLQESPKQLAHLQQSVAEGNAELLERTAHRLKGELSYLGMPDASQNAHDLEQMGHKRDLKSASELLAVLEAEISAVGAAMRQRRRSKT
jgi:HPt (histidine-containing phosphotransfer) domain-containing protein